MIETTQKLPAPFGSFYLYDFIGQGGMAEIFLAKTFTNLGADRLCAIKRILPHLNADQSFCEMLIHEAKLCARLSHANVVQTIDLGQIDGQYYIAMEYVEGFDLNQLLSMLAGSKRTLSLQFGLYIIICALRGLDYAHRLSSQEGDPLGIIHCDVSPTNILISTDGDVKLCDFGIAKATFGVVDAGKLYEYHIKGKIAYMAPEHLDGRSGDHRADLYSAGILLWELLCGRRLYKRKDEDETLRLAKAAEVPPITNANLPKHEELNQVVSRALAKDPDDRYQTGQEFIRALEDYMHSAGLMVSQLKFADFLMEHFGEQLLGQRRARERHLAELITIEGQLDENEPESDELSDRNSASGIRATFDQLDDEDPFDEPLDLVSTITTTDQLEKPDKPKREDLRRDSTGREPSVAIELMRQNINTPQDSDSLLFQWITIIGIIIIAAAVVYFIFFH